MYNEKMRANLIELLSREIFPREGVDPAEVVADYLLDNGVIVPTCKVGDKVYALVDMGGTSPAIVEGVVAYHDDDGCKRWVLELYLYDSSGGIIESVGKNVYEEDFGKTVFLSREDAERALAEKEKSDA